MLALDHTLRMSRQMGTAMCKPLLLIVCILSIPASAADVICAEKWVEKAKEACDSGHTQEFSRCLGKKRQQADNALNQDYKKLKDDLVDPADLIKAQRSWITYRDNECAYTSSGYDCTSGISGMCSISTGICEMQLTCERVRRLREHIEYKCNGCPPRKSDGQG